MRDVHLMRVISGHKEWESNEIIPGGILVSTVVCSCGYSSHPVVAKGEYWVQAWKGSEIDQPFALYGRFEAVCKLGLSRSWRV